MSRGKKPSRQQRAYAQRAAARERERRALIREERIEGQTADAIAAAEAAGIEPPELLPPVDRRPAPTARLREPTAPPATTGKRVPGQQIGCGWCGRPITLKRTGPLPKWCSDGCRHRAWEQTRAAASGKAAVQVLDRLVTAVPGDGPGWVQHLGALLRQLNSGPTVIADQHLDQLATALDRLTSAVAERQRWRGRHEPWY